MRPLNTRVQQRLRNRLCGQHARLLSIAWSWCHDRMLAEDLVQETLARALDKLANLRDERKLEAWTVRVMLNLYRDLYRRPEPITGIDFDIESPADGPETAAERDDAVREIRWAMMALSEDQRQVVSLVDIAEFSYADTAHVLGVPVGTVMSRLFRARQRLRRTIEQAERREPPPQRWQAAV